MTVWVDADDRNLVNDVFSRVMSVALDEFKANNLSQVEGVMWGPFDGSRFISLFGQSNDEPNGKGFKARLKRFADGFRERVGSLPKGVRILLIVGSSAVTIATSGATAAAAAATFNVPAVYAQVVIIGNTVVNAGDSLRKIFHENDPTLSKEEKEQVKQVLNRLDGTKDVPNADEPAVSRSTQELHGLTDDEFQRIKQGNELTKRYMAGQISQEDYKKAWEALHPPSGDSRKEPPPAVPPVK